MAGFSNFTPEVRLALGAGILQGQNFAQGLGIGAQNAGVAMAAQKAKTEAATSENLTRSWLQKQYPDQDFSQMPAELLRTYASEAMKSKFAKPDLPSIADEYNFAKSQGYIGSFMDYQQTKANFNGGSQTKFGLNTIPGVDANGNPVLLQVNDQAQATQTQMPDGVKVSKEPIKFDAGTHFILLDPITRQNIGTIPKDVAGVQEQTVTGKTLGENKVALPGNLAKADQAISDIDAALTHPGLEKASGWQSAFPTMPGTDAADFEAKLAKLQGGAFLEAFASLKGGGQITEIEGKKATDAIAVLQTSQSDAQLRQALRDLREVIRKGRERSMNAAGVTVPAQTTEGANTTSTGVTWKKK